MFPKWLLVLDFESVRGASRARLTIIWSQLTKIEETEDRSISLPRGKKFPPGFSTGLAGC